MLQPVIIAVQYTNEKGEQEERHKGFLTGDSHAMYVENIHHRIIFVKVIPTDDPNVYLDLTGWTPLGFIDDPRDAETVIGALAKKLHNITAYEFMMQVLVHVKEEIGFEDWIIPELIK